MNKKCHKQGEYQLISSQNERRGVRDKLSVQPNRIKRIDT